MVPAVSIVCCNDLQEESFSYDLLGDSFESVLIWDTSFEGPRPVVLVVPDSNGQDDFEKSVAQRLANLGYAAIAVGLFNTAAEAGVVQVEEICKWLFISWIVQKSIALLCKVRCSICAH